MPRTALAFVLALAAASAHAAAADPITKLAGHVFPIELVGQAPAQDGAKPKLTFSNKEVSSPFFADQFGVQSIAYTATAGKGGSTTFTAKLEDGKGNTLTITGTLQGHAISGSIAAKPKTGDAKSFSFKGQDASFPVK